MQQPTVIAIDIGAESGRVMAVHAGSRRLRIEELHRFPTQATSVRGTLYWDILHLWQNVQGGIAKGLPLRPASLGVDTWGVDFALLDARDRLIGNPVHYRDGRTDGMQDRLFERVSREQVFAQTGIQFMPINTIYQLMSLVAAAAPELAIARTFLTVPDLLNFWLTGERACEFTNATTTQLYNPRSGGWAEPLLAALDLPARLFPPIVPPGTRLGSWSGVPVIAPACHDTGSSVAAVPATTARFAYISSGTWSLVGLEVAEPVINAEALAANVTNEGGVDGTYRLLKNVMGLWIVQQCRATWEAAGQSYSYAELVRSAESAPPLRSLIDPNAACFLPPGDHPALIRAWCAEHGQPVPQTVGAIVRCVLDSLALAYREVLETLAGLAGWRCEVVHVVGGGARNELLCQLTANATGLPVVAGPVEATVLGNALVQLIALGELADLAEARERVRMIEDLPRYEPQETARWAEAAGRYQAMKDRRNGQGSN